MTIAKELASRLLELVLTNLARDPKFRKRVNMLKCFIHANEFRQFSLYLDPRAMHGILPGDMQASVHLCKVLRELLSPLQLLHRRTRTIDGLVSNQFAGNMKLCLVFKNGLI